MFEVQDYKKTAREDYSQSPFTNDVSRINYLDVSGLTKKISDESIKNDYEDGSILEDVLNEPCDGRLSETVRNWMYSGEDAVKEYALDVDALIEGYYESDDTVFADYTLKVLENEDLETEIGNYFVNLQEELEQELSPATTSEEPEGYEVAEVKEEAEKPKLRHKVKHHRPKSHSKGNVVKGNFGIDRVIKQIAA